MDPAHAPKADVDPATSTGLTRRQMATLGMCNKSVQ